jgi:hypothetical protein
LSGIDAGTMSVRGMRRSIAGMLPLIPFAKQDVKPGAFLDPLFHVIDLS